MALRWIPCVLLVAACASGSGSGGGTGSPISNRSPETTVKAFLAAARDTNLTLMASYWGGSAGPAATSKQPPDYEKRIRILQKYLTSDSSRVAGLGTVDGHPDQVMVTMQMFVGNCRNNVPFIVGKWKDQYIVQNVDVTMTATPGRPCNDQGTPM